MDTFISKQEHFALLAKKTSGFAYRVECFFCCPRNREWGEGRFGEEIVREAGADEKLAK